MTEFDKVIPPGREGKVTASVNTDHIKGPTTKSVTVTTNDTANPRFVLEIKANITVPIDVQPSDNIQLQAKLGEAKSSEVTISAVDKKPFDIVSISDVPGIKSVMAPVSADGKTGTAKDGKDAVAGKSLLSGSASYKLTVSTLPDAAVGRTWQTVNVATNHPKVPTLPIHVSLFVQGEVEVVPERVYIQAAAPANPAGVTAPPQPAPSQTVKIRKSEGAPLKLEGVTSSDPDITATLKTVTEGKEYDLEIKYSGKPGRGMVSAQVSVKTNVAKQEQVVIPVVART